MTSHDHNFKNVFLDFPKEALEWVLPNIPPDLGKIQGVSFVRQEPAKRRLTDSHLSLDMPILYRFENGQVLLWLVEFEEKKGRFSIYRLLRYATDLMEQYPESLVIPTVLFTAAKAWRTDVRRALDIQLGKRHLMHFEYVLIKLFDYHARDYYNYPNPVVKILLPKMQYEPKERVEVIRQAYWGLFELVAPMLFDKYLDFIDVYAGIQAEEREALYRDLAEKEETAMLAQYIKNKGFDEGIQQGIQQGIRQGIQKGILQGLLEGITALIEIKFGDRGMKILSEIGNIHDAGRLRQIKDAIKAGLDVQEIEKMILH